MMWARPPYAWCMQQRPRGPQFERAAKQRVFIGDYESPTRPGATPPAAGVRQPTLLERLRARFRGGDVDKRRGPGFQQPEGAARIGRYQRRRRNRSAPSPSESPSGFEQPSE